MITVDFYQKGNRLTGFDIKGHSGYADAGMDIVCAAVSSAVQMTANLITEIFGFNANVTAEDNENNFISVRCENLVGIESEDSAKIISGLELQLRLIQGDYKDCIEINYTEV